MHLKPKAPVSKLTKLIRNETCNEKGIRGGVRGGKDKFSWDSLKNLSFKERENYIGYSEKIGLLQNGRWKKNDWYLNINRTKINKEEIKNEIKIEKEKEKNRILKKLGIIKEEKKNYLPLLNKDKANDFSSNIKLRSMNDTNNVDFINNKGLGYKSEKITKKIKKNN